MKKQKSYSIPRGYEKVGALLREMRLRADLTQREVADILGYSSAQFISNFERGIATPPLMKLKVLIKLYQLNVDTVMNLLLDAERARMGRVLKK